MSEIKIEKGIPLPERPSGIFNKYPWKEMAVGDSFLVPRANGEVMALTRDRANKGVQYAQRFGHKYCTRTVEDGIRIWRIE